MTRATKVRWSALAAIALAAAPAAADPTRADPAGAEPTRADPAGAEPANADRTAPLTEAPAAPATEDPAAPADEDHAAPASKDHVAPVAPPVPADGPRRSVAPAAGPAPLAPAPVDLGAFPPRPPAKPETRPLGVELHGFAAMWWIPWSQEGPGAATDAFRLRFAVLRVDARPAPKVTVVARLGLMLPGSPLLDMAATYQAADAVGITVGQFRLPLGASATTLAPQLVMLDRPRYVYAMTKLAFRDVGAMVHSGPAGLANGMVHYRLALASGSGRLGSGIDRPPGATEYLIAGRVLVDAGRWLAGPRDRLVAGLSYARSRDPAIDTGTLATDRGLAVNTLGRTLVPFGDKRVTHLAGADLSLARGPVWAQAETLYLRSHATDGDAHAEALGLSLEAGYTLPLALPLELQVAARGERFDPNLDADADAQDIASFGLNATTARMRWSAFVSVTRFEDATTGARRHAGELALRAAATF